MPPKLAASSAGTVVSLVDLKAELRRTRARGYAIDRGGWHDDVGGIAVPVTVLLLLQIAFDMPQLLPWSAALEAVFYFYAAGSLIAYMMEDRRATTDELFAAGATFTLFAWAIVGFALARSSASAAGQRW